MMKKAGKIFLFAVLALGILAFRESSASAEAVDFSAEAEKTQLSPTPFIDMADGEYTIAVDLEGGTGRSSINSPCTMIVKDGLASAQILWSSSHYDYMIVNDIKYMPVNEEGDSAFQIPITVLDEPMKVIANTTAMSVPHEIEYTLVFHSDQITAVNVTSHNTESLNARTNFIVIFGVVFIIALCVIALCIWLFIRNKKRRNICLSWICISLICISLICIFSMGIILFGFLSGRSGNAQSGKESASTWQAEIREIEGLTYTERMPLSYADQFAVDFYESGYACIQIAGEGAFLLVPEDAPVPQNLPEDMTLLEKPVSNIYLAASAAMDMFVALDGLDHIAFTALKQEDWFIDGIHESMEQNRITYAGKYSAPDYEQILAGGCELAIENTMIYHSPEVKEQLEKFGIPVLVDHSSYESHPLGRTEWVKLYGLLTDHLSAAESAFDRQEAAFADIRSEEKSGKTVAFFYITSNGQVNVRKSSDAMAKMIDMAGGTYIFDHLGDKDDTASSTVSMSIEEFYASAKDADYIIYNSTIEGELQSIDELLTKSSLLANFKAVQDGNVFCATRNIYQSSMELGTIIADIHYMMENEDQNLTYLYRLQ